MQITLQCPQCGATLEAETGVVEQEAQCPECGAAVTVPGSGLSPGMILGGFRIERRIGRGGMGEVFLATQLSMDRRVALKILPPAMTADSAAVGRFLHEVRMLARLDHPSIVTAHDAGADGGVHFFAMGYVEGESLEERLKREGTLPEQEALEIARRVARALAYAWDEQRLLHRDIKPANIMLDRHGEVKVMDMGLAKSFGEDNTITVTGAVMGTPHYMSPEQAEGSRDLDFRADIYALGATLYHLVTGSVPYVGTTTVAVLMKQVREPFPPPQERNPAVSAGCAHLLEVMMAKDPAQRYTSWQAVIADVERVLNGGLPAAPRPGAAQSMIAQAVSPGARRPTRLEGARRAAAHPAHKRVTREDVVAAAGTSRHSVGLALGVVGAVLIVAVLLVALARRGAPGSEKVSGAPRAPDPAAAAGRGPDPSGSSPASATATESPLLRLRGALMRVNPDAGEIRFRVRESAEGPVLDLSGNQRLTDISPLRGAALAGLDLSGTWVRDIGALRGIPLVVLHLTGSRVSDLGALAGMPLVRLRLAGLRLLTDITALHGMPLVDLDLCHTGVSDLGALEGMPLVRLLLYATPVSDLGPLRGLPLRELWLGACPNVHDLTPLAACPELSKVALPEHVTELAPLRNLPKLEILAVTDASSWEDVSRPAAEFWEELDAQAAAAAAAAAAEAAARRARWERLKLDIAADLLGGDAGGAVKRLTAAKADEDMVIPAAELPALETGLAAVTAMPQRVLQSFAAQIGQVVSVSLREGQVTIEVQSVEAGRVTGMAVAPGTQGRVKIKRSFGFADLHVSEQVRRLGEGQAPELQICRGLLALGTGRRDTAQKYFELADDSLGAALLARLDERAQAAREAQAVEAFKELLRVAGVSPDRLELAALIESVDSRAHDAETCARLKAGVSAFRERHGASEVARDLTAVLDVLAALQPEAEASAESGRAPAGLSEERRRQLEDDLRQANPQVQELTMTCGPDTSGAGLLLSLNDTPELIDISPLAGLPLVRLSLYNTRVSNLAPLKGMKLTDLNLQKTRVADLSPLAGLPLKRLNLSETFVTDLRPLAGMPLQNLSIARLSGLSDLSPLKGMPLEILNLYSTLVSDISVLEGMPLKHLVLNNTEVRDFRALKSLPLQILQVKTPGDCEFGDREARYLRGMALRQFQAFSCEFTDVRFLRGMPLVSLSLHFCPVKSLKPLEGMRIGALRLYGTAVTDLDPLKGMPLVHLDLAQTPVRDISVIRDLPLQALRLDECPEIRDFSPIADCKTLEYLTLPEHCTDRAFLADLPRFRELMPANYEEWGRLFHGFSSRLLAASGDENTVADAPEE